MKAGRPPIADVIDLDDYRIRRRTDVHPIFYLSRQGDWLDLLGQFDYVIPEDIRSPMGLRQALLTQQPDLILIESDLDWIDPVEAIEQIGLMMSTPIVLIRSRDKDEGLLLKRAFAAGIQDTLSAPLCPDELSEALGVLLKLRRCVAD